MYLICSILLCFCFILRIVYCKDEPSYFVFFITNENNPIKCISTKEVLKIRAAQRLHIPIVSTYHINKDIITIEKVQNGSAETHKKFKVYGFHPKVAIIKNDLVDKSIDGKWLIKVYISPNTDPPLGNVVIRNQLNYTEVICIMNVSVTEPGGFICEGHCITTWIAITVVMAVVIVAEAGLIFFSIYKANRNRKYAQLSTAVDKSNENSRYCGAPGQKPEIASNRDSSRESGIYEALEPMPMSRRPPIPEPSQLETLPRPPKPIPMTILREPLPDPPPITSSLLRPSTNNTPASLTRSKNQPPAPLVLQDENTYEPPPNYCGPPPKASLESEVKKPTSTTLKMENTKQTLTKKQKEQQKSKEQTRTSFERIKDRPQMPIPAQLQETKEVFEDMKSSSTASLLRNAESKTTSSPTASLARNAATQKSTLTKKTTLSKQPAELKENTATRFTKPKPVISQKPAKLDKPDNVSNELNDVLKKRKDKSPGLTKQATKLNAGTPFLRNNSTSSQSEPNNAADELISALKKRKETSENLARNGNGSITPSAEYPRKTLSPTAGNTNNKTPPSTRSNAGPTPGLSGPKQAPSPQNETTVVREVPPIPIHVEGVNYDEYTQSSDDEWTYEPLENYNIYSN